VAAAERKNAGSGDRHGNVSYRQDHEASEGEDMIENCIYLEIFVMKDGKRYNVKTMSIRKKT
jgi:hypothetical protein